MLLRVSSPSPNFFASCSSSYSSTRTSIRASRKLLPVAKVETLRTLASDMERIGSVKLQLEELFSESLKAIAPTEVTVKPLIASCKDLKFGDYQCNNAMGLFRLVRERFGKPDLVGEAIKDNLPASDVIQSCSVAKNGFINVLLSREWMAKRIQNMLKDGIATWGPKVPVFPHQTLQKKCMLVT